MLNLRRKGSGHSVGLIKISVQLSALAISGIVNVIKSAILDRLNNLESFY